MGSWDKVKLESCLSESAMTSLQHKSPNQLEAGLTLNEVTSAYPPSIIASGKRSEEDGNEGVGLESAG